MGYVAYDIKSQRVRCNQYTSYYSFSFRWRVTLLAHSSHGRTSQAHSLAPVPIDVSWLT